MNQSDEFGQRLELLRIKRDRLYYIQSALDEMGFPDLVDALEVAIQATVWEIYGGKNDGCGYNHET